MAIIDDVEEHVARVGPVREIADLVETSTAGWVYAAEASASRPLRKAADKSSMSSAAVTKTSTQGLHPPHASERGAGEPRHVHLAVSRSSEYVNLVSLSMSIIPSLAGDRIPDEFLIRSGYRAVIRIFGKDVVRIFGTRSRHSSVGRMNPAAFERKMTQAA
jgi:hypothetical protein